MASLLDLEFGGTDAILEATGVRGTSNGTQNPGTQAPPKASAAPVAGETNVFTGLTAALNGHQKQLVKAKKRLIPDEYIIEFAPPAIGAAKVSRPGPQDATTAPMQNPNTATKLDPAQNSVSREARTWPIEAGTQIMKVIDDVMRNSSFVTDQQNIEITTATDPVTGVQTQRINAKAGTGDMLWYKISVAAEQIGYDTIIRDHAYRMRFIITPYAVAQMTSQYFPDSRYKGVHKAYSYWFTGANTQILHYEQAYNNAYRLVLSGIGEDAQRKTKTDFRDQNRYIFMATSQNQATGAKNYANEPGNNAASFLYDPVSLSQVKMRIVGDPAWMQQGECAFGVSARTFNFSAFNADGGINYDSRAVMFSVAFNTPADYNLNTGLVNVNANSRNGQPQEYYTFQATKCKNIFSRGRFEQEIEGKLVIEKAITPAVASGRPPATATTTSATNSRTIERIGDSSLGYEVRDETGAVSNFRQNEYGDLYDATGTIGAGGLASPLPAAPAGEPTSSGPIDYSAVTTDMNATQMNQAPLDASFANSPNDGVQEKLALAANYEQRAAQARANGDVYNAATLDRLAAQSRANAAADAKYGAPPQNQPTQLIAKDD